MPITIAPVCNSKITVITKIIGKMIAIIEIIIPAVPIRFLPWQRAIIPSIIPMIGEKIPISKSTKNAS